MSRRLTKVKLYGHLRKFGKEFELNVRSPKEALHALFTMVDGFKEFVEQSEKKGIVFAVFNGRRNIGVDEFELGAKPEIRIATVTGGRKNGGGIQTVIGVILIAVAMYFSAGTAAGALGAFGAGGAIGATAMMGAALMIGGVVQMLTPTANINTDGAGDSDNSASYAFGGPVNTVAQGYPIPLLYGEREVGGAIVSASIVAADQS